MASHYKDFHLFDFNDEYLDSSEERLNPTAKNYEDPTWEPKSNIPEFILNYYERTGCSDIPAARIKHTKVVGGSKFHLLVWDDASGEMNWEEDEAFNFLGSGEMEIYSCNTRKDKDKRICRHSFGVLFGCWPCGVSI